MHFVFYPKHEYGCPHVGHCPHLGGASLGTLVLAADEQTEWTDALWRQIDALREETAAKSDTIGQLRARVEQLERELKAERQKQFKRKREEAKEEAEPAATGPKKRGAPVGHPGWYRKRPERVDRTILVAAPTRCPHCGAGVKARLDLPRDEHLQEDWIDGRRVVTCYQHVPGRCTSWKCRRWVQQAGPGELRRARLGPHVRAAGLFLQYDIGLSTRKVARALAGLAAFALAPASLVRFAKEAARKAKPLADDVAEKLRACEAVHADETYYRINGQSAYVWFHGNEDLAHFHVCPTRSGQVSRKLLGEDYQGGLVTDCYAGYDRHRTPLKQKCLAHVKRTAVDWEKLVPPAATDSRAFFEAVRPWVKRACRWRRMRKQQPEAARDGEAQWLREELDRLETMPTDSERAARLQKRLRRYHREWLTFLDHPAIAPTNNCAEQALRALVILRKLTFGSRTRAGARRLGVMLTVIETAKRQGQRVLPLLVTLLTHPPNRALRAMYGQP